MAGDFLKTVEIESALIGLASTYPSVTQLITLPFFTAELSQSHAVRIGNVSGSGPCPRDAVLIIGGAHAREWGGPDICVYFAADLLEAWSLGSGLVYGRTSYTADEIRRIINRLDVIVFPCINPDGYLYSRTVHAMWRKNRNRFARIPTPTIGVDVNRNYDFLWDFEVAFAPGVGSSVGSTNPSNELFHGPEPFSEAETKNVRWLFDQFPRISWFMDIHSYGGDILYSWGDDADQLTTPEMNFTNPAWDGRRGSEGDAYGEFISASDLRAVQETANAISGAIGGVRGESYTVAQSYFLPNWPTVYPTSGASDDWAFSRYFADPSKRKVRAYTMEFRKTPELDPHFFFPTWAEMQPIILDVDAGLVMFCLRAAPWTAFWWCRTVQLLRVALVRLFPPDIWGPYGPWGRIRRLVQSITAPFLRVIDRVFGRIFDISSR